MQTLREQQVPTAHTLPKGQSALVPQSARPAQGVLPLTQNPLPPVMEAQTQLPPGPQEPKLPQLLPVQPGVTHAPLVHCPDGHELPQAPQLLGSFDVSTQEPLQRTLGVGHWVTVAVAVTVTVGETVEVEAVMP